MTLVSTGCSTTQIRPVTLPKPFKPSYESVEWLKDQKAPKYVVDDFVDCTALGIIIEDTTDKTQVTRTDWSFMSIISTAWSVISGFFTGLWPF